VQLGATQGGRPDLGFTLEEAARDHGLRQAEAAQAGIGEAGIDTGDREEVLPQ